MKKVLFSVFFASTLILGVSSCTKDCYICRNSGDEISLCKEDFESSKEYNSELKKLKALGFVCK